MNLTNSLAARVMSDILCRGMSLSSFNIGDRVKSDAIDALCEVNGVLISEMSADEKLSEIEKIMERYIF